MKNTITISGSKARQAILKGVNAITEPVRSTFGPEGRNALLYRTMNRGNRIVNDGVTVAECQEPKDIFVRMAASTFKESCKKTNEKVGDGTTCTTILGGKLFNDIYSLLETGHSELLGNSSGKIGVMSLKKKIIESANRVKEEINNVSKKVKTLKDLEKIATVSIEDEELGKIIAKMAWDVGIDGFIDVVEGYKGEIETEVIKGMRFPAKIPAKAFVNHKEHYEMIAEQCPVLITNYKIDNLGDYVGMLKDCSQVTSKVIVIASGFGDNVLIDMINTSKSGYFIYPVSVPSLRTEQFEDLAIYCGAQFINKDAGIKLKTVNKSYLGFLEKLIVKDSEAKEDAIATGGQGTKTENNPLAEKPAGFSVDEENKQTKIEERIEILKGQLKETKQEQFKKLLERRIASMASAVGIIRVGDSTQAESLYRKLKIEDAVYACKAGLRGGYVKGGGLCLKEISDKLPEDDILKETLKAPYEQIQNSIDGGIEIGEDIIDPAEAIYYAVEHSTQVVANLITVESITAEEEEMNVGEAELEIAKALKEMVITDKIKEGQLKENQTEEYRDMLGGMNAYEYEITNRD
jgi:chaperonin GroEL